MTDPLLYLPIAIVFAGAGLASLLGCMKNRPSSVVSGLILSLAPLAAAVFIFSRLPLLDGNTVLTYELAWFSNFPFTLYMDSLSAFFALLVSVIGVLVVVYAGYYFHHDRGSWRFFTYILMFMGSMIGLVMAGDIISLFIFWEGTSIVSFLLVAYKFSDPEARRGGFKSLFITGGGGIALLMGLLVVSYVVGDTRFSEILTSGDALRASNLYLLALGLVALGAFTKSAQFPFHIWLPDAMTAPTPASAYLHSATMVKAGIYLMARMNPVLGMTEAWFWLLSIAGMITMLIGAVLALKRTDLKGILAYSTVCQLGILMMMIGQDMAISFKALIIGILAHAMYKSALFLVAGIVDHETGTRDITRLGGLRKSMPLTFWVAAIAGLSAAGLPPLFGFLAKETLLATTVHESLPFWANWMFTASSVLAGAFMLTIAARLVCDTFLGKPKDPSINSHDPAFLMVLAPGIPAIGSLLMGQFPGFKEEAVFLANAATNAYGSAVKVNTSLWHGLNIPLALSGIAMALGTLMFIKREPLINWLLKIKFTQNMNTGYEKMLSLIDAGAKGCVSVQQGKIRHYMAITLVGVLGMLALFNGFPPPLDLSGFTAFRLDTATELAILRIVGLFLVCGTALACVFLKKDFDAILAFGACGIGVALLMILEPATDVALVQIVADVLIVIILVLALTAMPKDKLEAVQKLAFGKDKSSQLLNAMIAGAFGIVVMFMTLSALLSRPRISELSPWFNEMTYPATGSTSIVGTILTDFRGVDTLFEVAVFGIAGLGILTLIRFAGKLHNDFSDVKAEEPAVDTGARGIGSPVKSPILRVLAHVVLPMTLVVAICDLFYGHDLPGDGFTAGVIISIGIAFQYMVFGFEETKKRMPWVKPSALVGWGLALGIGNGFIGLIVNGEYFSPVNVGKLLGIPLPKSIYLDTSVIFEVAICLGVVGSVNLMLNSLGKPKAEEGVN